MPQRLDVTGQVNNAETLVFQILKTDGTPFPLQEPIRFVVKYYASDHDDEAVIDETSEAPSVRITMPLEGRAEADYQIATPWRYWWRVDAQVSGKPSTALYGYLKIEAT